MSTATGILQKVDLAGVLVRAAHEVQRIFTEVSREHDLTPQQAQLLCLLIDGPRGMSELSRELNLEKSSLTGLVDRAVRRGLVTRTAHSCDRRACLAQLTEEGTRFADDAHRGVVDRLESLAAHLHPAERRLIAEALSQLFGGGRVR